MAGLVSATRTARYLPRQAEIIRCNIDPIKSQLRKGGGSLLSRHNYFYVILKHSWRSLEMSVARKRAARGEAVTSWEGGCTRTPRPHHRHE